MTERQATRPFDGETLAEIERRLHGRLRAHHVSDQFIDRHLEDAVQKGVVEYLRVGAEGVEVREPRGFVAEAAFRRALDELRRESRQADGAALEQILESGRHSTAPAEEIAIENLESRQLREAIDSLPAEERQVLALHYFEEVDQRHAAELLYMSERTFRRRLRRTLSDLAQLLGAPAPEPGSHHGLEIGLAAWAGLGGARVVVSSGPLDRLAALPEAIHRALGRGLDRLRGPGTRVAASDAPERIGTLAGGPAGKVLGGCAGAAIVCALSGVFGPGLDLGHGSHPRQPHPRQTAEPIHHRASTHPIPIDPRTGSPTAADASPGLAKTAPSGTGRPARRGSQKSHKEPSPRKEEPQPTEAGVAETEAAEVEEQFSAVAQATKEAEAESPGTNTTSSSLRQGTSAESTGATESSRSSAEERQVEKQFRGPLAE